jgi:hypothetical protein
MKHELNARFDPRPFCFPAAGFLFTGPLAAGAGAFLTVVFGTGFFAISIPLLPSGPGPRYFTT